MRANSPATKREQLYQLICSRHQGHELWTDETLADAMCVSVRTVRRWREWLRREGRLPVPLPSKLADTMPLSNIGLRRHGT